ncbi:Serine/threonine protein phosphatase 2A 55 kDa regulatory subunit B beta isoform, partial [Ananas comosus]
DVISAIEFDSSGSYLATGYRGGQIVLSERTDIKNHVSRRDLERADYSASRHAKYSYKTQFQSHKSEFDSLRSLEISEKINKIRWCQPANSALYLLSTNDKTIKFWKVQEKKVKIISEMNSDTLYSSGNCSVASSSTASPPVYLPNGGRLERQYNYISNDLSFPPEGFPSLRFTTVASQQKSLIAQCRRVYANSHDYNIHSISNNSDGETFISADDLRINLWNLEMCNQGFNIVDAKPANMEHLSEVITCAEFHPTHCNILAYSSSNGSIRLIDMRQSALCDKHSQLFVGQKSPALWSPFTGIISSISDIKFEKNGRHILSRDYMTVKLWDINMDSGPVATFSVHEYLRPMWRWTKNSNRLLLVFVSILSAHEFIRLTLVTMCLQFSVVNICVISNQFRVFSCAGENCEETTLEASTNPM